MRRYLPSTAVNGPVGLGDYTRAMMINRILTICAAAALGAAGTSLAHAQQGYPVPPGSVYSAAPVPIRKAAMSSTTVACRTTAACRISTRWTMTTCAERAEFGRAAAARSGAVAQRSPLWPPDGRAGPVYSERPMPTGPILSPDDPRYGRPAGPPPVIYYDRAAGTQQAYPDRDNGVPAAGVVYGNEDRGLRPPEAIRPPESIGAARRRDRHRCRSRLRSVPTAGR